MKGHPESGAGHAPGLSRRLFLALTAGAGAAAFTGAGRRASLVPPGDDDRYFHWSTARADWLHVAPGPGGHTVVVGAKGGDGAIVIDTQVSPLGAALRREGEHFGRKILQVINTHHHEGVTGGNHAFVKDVPVLAQAKAGPRIVAQLNRYRSQIKEFVARAGAGTDRPGKAGEQIVKDWRSLHDRMGRLSGEDFAPTQTMDTATRSLDAGGRALVLHYLPGHTDNDLVVHLPDDNVVLTGGLVSHRIHPEIDRAGGGSTKAWLLALDQLETLCDAKTLLIPGEGEATDRAAVRLQRDYMTTLREAVTKAIQQGKARAQVRALRPNLQVLPNPRDNQETRLAMSLDALYDEIKADHAPAQPAPTSGG